MGFRLELQGDSSHDALLHLQDAEIRLLETARKCITHRIKCDRDYANALSYMVTMAAKLDGIDLNTPVYKTWKTIIKETETLIGLIRSNADNLNTKTLEHLVQLINEKKSARKFYNDEHNRLELEYTKLQDEAGRLKNDYDRTMAKVAQDRAKYEDLKNKGKGGSKFEDAKSKLLKSTFKLHKVHNDYVLALQEANLHQRNHACTTLPCLLDYQQKVQENIAGLCQDIFQEYSQLTDASSELFSKCHKDIRASISSLSPHSEYDDFQNENRSNPVQVSALQFQCSILEESKATLKADEIVLDDLTIPFVREVCDKYKVLWTDNQHRSEHKKLEIERLNEQLSKAGGSGLGNGFTSSANAQRKALAIMERELQEIQCNEEKYKMLYEFANTPLAALGDKEPPAALVLDGISSQDIKDKSDTGSVSSNAGITSPPSNSFTAKLSQMKLTLPKFAKHHKTPPSKDYLDHQYQDQGDTATSPASDGLLSPSAAKSNPAAQKSKTKDETSRHGSSVDGYQTFTFGNDVEMTLHPNRKLDEEDWFHGVLPREEVVRLLKTDGDYLVRESKNRKTGESQYVLSVMWEEHKHFIIQGQEGSWRFEGEFYPSIQELIIHQHKSELTVTKRSGAILQRPVLRETWELRNDEVKLGQKIGNGNFGEVFKGVYEPQSLEVAIKTCRETLSEDMKKKFLQEGRILKQYEHQNIVQFIGICAQRHPVMIVMEYVPGGALLNFLRKNGNLQTKKQLVKMCEDAAAGMAYLESNNCIHRDLAARNCLVGKNNTIKISDFGMSRDEQEYQVSGGMKQIPIKWTAPEALNFGMYTTACDVWSFGILMWEIFSLGQTPYPGMTNTQAKEKADDGYRMSAPEGTPPAVYELMLKSWEAEAKDRPRFKELNKDIGVIYLKMR